MSSVMSEELPFKAFKEQMATLQAELDSLFEKHGISKDLDTKKLSAAQKSRLETVNKHTAALNNPDLSASELVKAAKTINHEIFELQEQLHALTSDAQFLRNPDNHFQALYLINVIQQLTTSLTKLADKAEEIGKKEPKKITEMENALLGQGVFKDTKMNNPLTVLSWLTKVFSGKVASTLLQISSQKKKVAPTEPAGISLEQAASSQSERPLVAREATSEQVSIPPLTTSEPRTEPSYVIPEDVTASTRIKPDAVKKKTETVPKWLEEITAVSTSVNGFRQLRALYKQTKTYSGDSIDHRLARLMQPTSTISKKRAEQLQLIENTLVLLEKGNYTPDEKTRIARGLMLVIKYQIDREHNVFESRLGAMVNNYLNRTDNSNEKNRNFSAQECLVDFDNFSRNNFSDNNHKKMRQQISDALHNETWREKQFYSLHQMIDSIKVNVSAIDVSTLLEHKDKKRGEESIIKFLKMKNDFIGWNDKVKKLPLKKILDMPRNMLSPITAACAELERLLKELEANKQAGKDNTDTKADLYIVSGKIEIMLTACDYAIKIAEEKIPKLSNLNSIEQVKEDLNSLEMPLKDLQNLCARAIKELPSKMLSADTELTKKTKNSRGLFSLFKSASTRDKEAFNKSETLKELSNLHDKIKAIPAALSEHPQLNDFETAYNKMMQDDQNTPLLSLEGALNTAKELYKNMNSSSTENVPAPMLLQAMKSLTQDTVPADPEKPQSIFQNINSLSDLLKTESLEPTDKEKENIYIGLRKIEKQLETLEYLTKIAALKLDPAVNVVRRVNDTQAQQLKDVFSDSNLRLPGHLSQLQELRTIALKKLGIEPKHGSKP